MGFPFVHIGDLVYFNGNGDILVKDGARDASPEELYVAISAAFEHSSDPDLVNACCGGGGPLGEFTHITYEGYLELLDTLSRVKDCGYKPSGVF